ncbi:hypothetical protein BDF21DRAFT_363185, partial [Thamnidium elegans]
MKLYSILYVLFLTSVWASNKFGDYLQVVKPGTCVNPLNATSDFFSFMKHFNVISINSVYADNSLFIKGPLAAGADLTAPGSISINMRQRNTPCSNSTEITSMGIYTRTLAGLANILVSGQVITRTKTNTGKYFVQVDRNCKTYSTFGSLFSIIYPNTMAITHFLWGFAQTPSHQIKDDRTVIKNLHNFDERFWTFTVGLCGADACQATSEGLQSTGDMFISSEWKGPSAPGYPVDRVIIINVALNPGTVFNINALNPSIGLNGCRVVYNFAPADDGFNIYEEYATTIRRISSGTWTGMLIASYSTFSNSDTGSFTGQLVVYEFHGSGRTSIVGDFEDIDGTACNLDWSCWPSTNASTAPASNTSYIYELETTVSNVKEISVIAETSKSILTSTLTRTETTFSFIDVTSTEIVTVTDTQTRTVYVTSIESSTEETTSYISSTDFYTVIEDEVSLTTQTDQIRFVTITTTMMTTTINVPYTSSTTTTVGRLATETVTKSAFMLT